MLFPKLLKAVDGGEESVLPKCFLVSLPLFNIHFYPHFTEVIVKAPAMGASLNREISSEGS